MQNLYYLKKTYHMFFDFLSNSLLPPFAHFPSVCFPVFFSPVFLKRYFHISCFPPIFSLVFRFDFSCFLFSLFWWLYFPPFSLLSTPLLFFSSLFSFCSCWGLKLSTSGFHAYPRTTCTNEPATMLKYMAPTLARSNTALEWPVKIFLTPLVCRLFCYINPVYFRLDIPQTT
jgi:hypothetical protein